LFNNCIREVLKLSKIIELEEITCEYYLNIPKLLNEHIEALSEVENSLETLDISKAILMRLRAYYLYQDNIKLLLDKKLNPAGSDFFVETVLFYLKFILKKNAPHLTALSEKTIIPKRGSIRPDISIWNENEVVSIIECKTQLGWSRNSWESDFINREKKLKESFPNAKAYLLVMTSSNWSGFGNNDNVGKKYFTLTNIWPSGIIDNYEDSIINPIEPLFESIVNSNND
jgi:hypothetical protein